MELLSAAEDMCYSQGSIRTKCRVGSAAAEGMEAVAVEETTAAAAEGMLTIAAEEMTAVAAEGMEAVAVEETTAVAAEKMTAVISGEMASGRR